MPNDHDETGDRPARIEQVIERYRLEKKRRLQRRADSLWRKQEALQALIDLEKPLERVH
jgi:hypothetical protein